MRPAAGVALTPKTTVLFGQKPDATSMSQIALNAKLVQLKAANTLFAETTFNMMFRTKMSLGCPVPSTSTSGHTEAVLEEDM